MVDEVALVLKLVRLLHVVMQRGRFRELFDRFDQQLSLSHGQLRVLLERVKIIELVLLTHWVSF